MLFCSFSTLAFLIPLSMVLRNYRFYRNGNLTNFFCMFVMANVLESCLPLIEMEWLFFFDMSLYRTIICDACKQNSMMVSEKTRKKVTLFLKFIIDIEIQLQVFSARVVIS